MPGVDVLLVATVWVIAGTLAEFFVSAASAESSSVPTEPANVTARMAAFPVSATYNTPFEFKTIPLGWLNQALLPDPSNKPAIPGRPASVVTIPFAEILRISEFPVSAT